MILPVIFVENMISCIIWWNITMRGKALPSIRKKMISGRGCHNRSWNGWSGFLGGRHYISSFKSKLIMRRIWKSYRKSDIASWKMNPLIFRKYQNVSGKTMRKRNRHYPLNFLLYITRLQMTSWDMGHQKKNSGPM